MVATHSDETIMDISYEIFLQMAEEELNEENIALFNQEFPENGAIVIIETANNWDEDIGVLIDPEEFTEVWIGLLDKNEEMEKVFAKVLLSNNEDEQEYHIIWA